MINKDDDIKIEPQKINNKDIKLKIHYLTNVISCEKQTEENSDEEDCCSNYNSVYALYNIINPTNKISNVSTKIKKGAMKM